MDEKTYRCSVLTCGKPFPSASAVRSHRHREHPELLPRGGGLDGEALLTREGVIVKRIRAWAFALLRGEDEAVPLEALREFAEMPASQHREVAVRVGTRVLELCEGSE